MICSYPLVAVKIHLLEHENKDVTSVISKLWGCGEFLLHKDGLIFPFLLALGDIPLHVVVLGGD